jgi:hypothetical protein
MPQKCVVCRKRAAVSTHVSGLQRNVLKVLTIEIIIMQNDNKPQPTIIVRLRPILSRASAGRVLPTTNISSTKPAMS